MSLGIAGNVLLGTGNPYHYDAVATMLRLEGAYVFAQSIGALEQCAGLYVRSINIGGIFLLIQCGVGLDGMQLVGHGVNITLLQYIGLDGCIVSIIFVDVPCTEHDIVERSNRKDVLHLFVYLLATLPQTHDAIAGK